MSIQSHAAAQPSSSEKPQDVYCGETSGNDSCNFMLMAAVWEASEVGRYQDEVKRVEVRTRGDGMKSESDPC